MIDLFKDFDSNNKSSGQENWVKYQKVIMSYKKGQ